MSWKDNTKYVAPAGYLGHSECCPLYYSTVFKKVAMSDLSEKLTKQQADTGMQQVSSQLRAFLSAR